ncbi:MAG: hypothetical protein NVSMB9_10330 [Isosphaeraceae bacterium]
MQLRWVFLDVGNVLLDEDPLTYWSTVRHAEAVHRARPSLTFLDVLAEREKRALEGSRWPLYDAVYPWLGAEGCAAVWDSTAKEIRARFSELSPPVLGAHALIERLSREFRLGLIANQGGEARDHLDTLGLLGSFEVVALAEELGFHKPDPALFLAALRQAGAEPAECLMIGDRLENDILPAASLGMATAWVRWPERRAKGWRPTESDACAYLSSLERIAASLDSPCPSNTLGVNGIDSLAVEIQRVQRDCTAPLRRPR